MEIIHMTYQQFSFELDIPAKAWTNPGPETTKQTAGLKQEKQQQCRSECHKNLK